MTETKEELVAKAFNFGHILDFIRSGKKASRVGWHGKGMYIQIRFPDETSIMNKPYIYIYVDEKSIVPWVASQTDILAEDWIIIE